MRSTSEVNRSINDNDPVILRSQADWSHLYTYKTGINIEINYLDLKITRKNSVTMTPKSRRHIMATKAYLVLKPSSQVYV